MDQKSKRRANLKEWFRERSIPEKEKSYLSQLMSGKAAFGEKAARRLESDYGMGDGYLDRDAVQPGIIPAGARSGSDVALMVPVFDATASMGRGYAAPEHDVIVGGLQLDESWVRQSLGTISSPKNLAVIPAYGDSMTPTFGDSDLLLVDRGITDIKLDAVYVLGLNGDLYIKRLQRRPDGALLMISDNKSYEPYKIANGDREQFSVLGRVVWAWVGKKL